MGATLSRDELSLDLSIGACNGDNRATVVEESTSVRIRVRTSDPGGDDCADGITVELESSMGDRILIHDTTRRKVRYTRQP